MRIAQAGSRLLLTETPAPLWALGLLFVASGLFVLSVPLWSWQWPGFGGWERAGILAIGVGHFGGGLFTVSQPRAARVELDRDADVGRVEMRRLWEGWGAGPHSSFRLSAARALELVGSSDSDGDRQYRLRLWLEGSEGIWLQAQPIYGERYMRAHGERVLAFLGLPGPLLLGEEQGRPPRVPRAPASAAPVRRGRESAT